MDTYQKPKFTDLWLLEMPKIRKCDSDFPEGFLDRVLDLLRPYYRNCDFVLHCPSGGIDGPGMTVDIRREGPVQPKVRASAYCLPFPNESYDLIIADPPYTPEHSKSYGQPEFIVHKAMHEAHRVLSNGGLYALLHIYVPAYDSTRWNIVGIIGVCCGVHQPMRVLTIFRKADTIKTWKA